MYIGCGRLSIIITEGQMRIFLMTPVGVVVTTRRRERVKELRVPFEPFKTCLEPLKCIHVGE